MLYIILVYIPLAFIPLFFILSVLFFVKPKVKGRKLRLLMGFILPPILLSLIVALLLLLAKLISFWNVDLAAFLAFGYLDFDSDNQFAFLNLFETFKLIMHFMYIFNLNFSCLLIAYTLFMEYAVLKECVSRGKVLLFSSIFSLSFICSPLAIFFFIIPIETSVLTIFILLLVGIIMGSVLFYNNSKYICNISNCIK